MARVEGELQKANADAVAAESAKIAALEDKKKDAAKYTDLTTKHKSVVGIAQKYKQRVRFRSKKITRYCFQTTALLAIICN